MAEPLVRATGVSRRYGAILALVGVTLDVGAGELVGLLGPNGAGKPTFEIDLLAGLRLPPQEPSSSAGAAHETRGPGGSWEPPP